MSTLSVATEVIKSSWCKGQYRQTLPEGEKFCAVGALMQANASERGVSWKEAQIEPGVVNVLSDTILENYRTELENYAQQIIDSNTPVDAWNPGSIVVTFNDEIAQSHDEVVAMFEKATAKWEERV